ncbi:hypothetical protein BaRGS_00038736, partial [Batillaria attramentaria]
RSGRLGSNFDRVGSNCRRAEVKEMAEAAMTCVTKLLASCDGRRAARRTCELRHCTCGKASVTEPIGKLGQALTPRSQKSSGKRNEMMLWAWAQWVTEAGSPREVLRTRQHEIFHCGSTKGL